LAYKRALGRLAEMAGIGQRHQVLEIFQIHWFILPDATIITIDAVYQIDYFNQCQ
jgi:hypothetical protein